MKKILVLGASHHQLNTINSALNYGYKVVVADNIESNIGHKLANISCIVSTIDKTAILEVAVREKVDGIISPCTDIAVTTAAFIAETLKLPGVNQYAAEVLTSKLQFRKFQERKNLPHPGFSPLKSRPLKTRPGHTFSKGLIKPDRSSGGKGIFIINDSSDISLFYNESISHGLNDIVVYEEMISGQQITFEGVLINGKISLSYLFFKDTAPSPFVCTYGHTIYKDTDMNLKNRVIQEIETVYRLLNIDSCVIDADIVFDGNEIYIIETTPRLGGNSITDLVELSCGISLSDIAVQLALNEEIHIPPKITNTPSSVILLGAQKKGRLSINKENITKLESTPGVKLVNFTAQEGQTVSPFINGRECLASVFFQAETDQDLDTLRKQVKKIRLFEVT